MLVLVPEPSAADEEGDVAERADGKQCADAGQEAEGEQNAGDQFRCLSGVHEDLCGRAPEHIPVEIAVHNRRPENFMAVVDEQQTDNYPYNADASLRSRTKTFRKFHSD